MSTCGYTYAVESPAAASLRRHGLISSEYTSEPKVALRADCLSQYLAANGRDEEAFAMTALSFQTAPAATDGPRRGIAEPSGPNGHSGYLPGHGMSPYADQQPDQQRVHRIPVARPSPPSTSPGVERLSIAELNQMLTEREIPHSDCRTYEQLVDRLNNHSSLGRSTRHQPSRGRSPQRKLPESKQRASHSLMPMHRRNNPSKRPTPSPPRARPVSPPQQSRHAFHDPNAEVEIYCKPRPEVEPAPPEPSEPASPLPCRTEELLRQQPPAQQPAWVKGGPSQVGDPQGNCSQDQQERAEWEQYSGGAAAEQLFRAAKEGDIEEIQSLLGVGGVPVLSSRHPDSGASALHEACEAGQDRAAAVLVKAAQHEAKGRGGGDHERALHEWLNARNDAGNTALHIAAAAGHTLVVRTLMQAGADQDVLDLDGRTASQVAATEALQLAMSNTRAAPQQELKLRTGVFAGGTYLPSAPSGGSPGRRRVALVMGNDNYSGGVSKLTNCVNDAKDMALALQQLNFMVMVVSDQSRAQMLACIRAFRQGIRDSDIVLVYFSGHGVEHEGVPYLLPLGANAVHSSDYELEAVSLNWILKTLNTVEGSSTNLLFLDSCRINTTDDTFKGEGAVGYSMKGFRAPSGAEYCIALSSDPGTAAHSAPEGRNSVFTEHLLNCLSNQSVSSLDVEIMLRHVREGVMGATDQKQRPWTQSCLGVDGFRFLEPKP